MLNADKYFNILKESKPCNCAIVPDVLKPFKHGAQSCIFNNKREVNYKSGEIILKQDTNLTHVVCIKSGIVKQYIENDNGKNIIYNILSTGDMVGFSEVMTNRPINFSISALSETRTCLIPVENVMESMSNNTQMALEVLKYTNRVNQDIIRTFVNLTQKNMYQKVASLILYFSNTLFNSDEFVLPLSRQDLADMCSMTKESLIRVLKELKDSDYIQVKGNDILVKNQNALRKISS